MSDLKTRDILSYLSLYLLTKSLFDLFLVPGIMTSPITVEPFLVVFTAAGGSFLIIFLPSSVTGFHSLRILCTPLVFAWLRFVLCIISFMVGTPTNALLVILR